jgi:CheY-like chemotaxis protein
MQDPDVPPEAEGETDDGEGVVRPTAADNPAAAIARQAEFTAPPWTTAIALLLAATMEAGRPGFAPSYAPVDPEPLPQRDDANSRIFAFVDDLFFQAKIQETARKLNVKVEFCKGEKDLLDHMKQNGEEKPSLIIFDMNNANAKPLTLIPKLKSKLKKRTSIIGFLSHVQGDLKQKAHEVGCDMVLPRSAFSQNLPQLLRRHGAPEEETAG